jgi:hypothetical protein
LGFKFGNLNEIAYTVGLVTAGALAYLFVAPKLLSNAPFTSNGQFDFGGGIGGLVGGGSTATPDAAAAPEDMSTAAAVTFANDSVQSIMPAGLRLANIG